MADYTDPETLRSLSNIDPEFDAFLKQNQLPQADYTDINFFKKMVEQRNATTLEMLGPAPASVRQTDLTYTTRDGSKVGAILYQPNPSPNLPSPLIIMIHGGGFCVGAPEAEEQTCRNLVSAFSATCVSITYRLAPEFPFPAACEDCWDALHWAAGHASSWGADCSAGFIVGGISAGGNLSAGLALRARDEGLEPKLTGQFLAVPAVMSPEAVPEKWKPWYLSHEQNRDVPILPQAAVDMFMAAYNPDVKDSRYNVANHASGLANLPAAVVVVDGMDPLRDEGIIYERMLREAGNKTKLYVYPGLPHGHWGFFPFLKASDQFRKEQVEAFGWLLGKEPRWEGVRTSAEISAV